MTMPLSERQIPTQRWRETDPAPTTLGELTPDDYYKRVVLRTKDFIGTVYGTLLHTAPHTGFQNFTTIQLWNKRELTLRNDTECLVLD
jgi:hypothetical protein